MTLDMTAEANLVRSAIAHTQENIESIETDVRRLQERLFRERTIFRALSLYLDGLEELGPSQ